MVEEILKQNTALGITVFFWDPLSPTIAVITSNHKEGICINLHVLLASWASSVPSETRDYSKGLFTQKVQFANHSFESQA